VVDTVSGKTNYLINNDINSANSKNVAAKKLDIPIITEQDLMKMIKGE
jgi:DNA ligase (NAD+)